jgi:DNA polymerase I
MADKKLFLLDALALIYRAHFAFIKTPRITSTGQNTSAVFGFITSLMQILETEHPTHLAVAFDLSGPTFRHLEYPEYKATREEMPEDIRFAIPKTKELLRALNIPILEMEGYEADDVIGTIAKRAEGHGYKVYMVTPDKDYAQLVTDNILLYKPSRQGNGIEIYNPAMVKERYGVTPDQMVDFLALKGDKVDNIPGIPKIGDITAVELINQFGSVEEIIRRSDEITKKAIQASVKEHAEQGMMSKWLARIEINAPVPWDEELLKVGDPDRDKTIEIMNQLEFKTTAKRILNSLIFGGGAQEQQMDLFGNSVAGSSASSYTPTEEVTGMPTNLDKIADRPHTYIHVDSEQALKKLIADIQNQGSFCFDTETTGLDAMQAQLIAMTVSLAPSEAYLIYFPEGDTQALSQLEDLRPVLESKTILKIGQNLKYDMLVLRNYGVTVCEPLYDTMLAHYVIDPDKPHGMDAMAMELLNYEPVSIKELIGKKGKDQLTMRDVEFEKLLAYACEDADITLTLKGKLDPKLDAADLRRVFETVEMPLVPVLTDVEFHGVRINEHFLNEYSKVLDFEMLSVEKDIYRLAGMKFNINSPKQLGEIIFDKLKLGKAKKTKTGQYSTKEEDLVYLAEEHDFPAYILRYRKLGKLKSTYVDALPLLVNPKTGRIHSTLSQSVTATGRLSSTNPNLQNIPIRTEEGREIRKAFIPEEGFVIMSADYSQVELRLIAELSKDPNMLEAFRGGHDIHRATAAKVFGVPMEEVTSDMRSKAKMVNFGIIYGISAFGLSQRLKISRSEAAEIINSYFTQYSRIKEYMDESIVEARQHGYARTLLGRRRYLPDINSANATIRNFAERNAINSPVQGGAADLIKVAMTNIHHEMKRRNMRSQMILQVHDELVFEAHKDEVAELSKLVKELMENAIPMQVPMLVEVGTGENWLEAH